MAPPSMRLHRFLFVSVAAAALSASGRAEPPSSVERFRLDNGLTALLRPVAGASDVAVAVLYAVGGDHDPEGLSGLAHLVEHLYVTAAAGGSPARSAEEMMRRYPKGWNAETGDRYTVFAGVVAADALAAELHDAAARMGDLRIAESDLVRERPRILLELEHETHYAHDDPEHRVPQFRRREATTKVWLPRYYKGYRNESADPVEQEAIKELAEEGEKKFFHRWSEIENVECRM